MPLRGHAAFRGIVWSALLAALTIGVPMSLLQEVTTATLIAEAERYEHGPALQAPHAAAHETTADQSHDHEEHTHPAWEPADGVERAAFTALATVLAAFGYALMLGAALTLMHADGVTAGLALGAAGFVVFQLAPALGMPPAPPGVPLADLLPRQTWWLGTVLCTALALVCWLRARRQSPALWIAAGAVLILLPHVIGAPQAPAGPVVVPEALVHRFAITAIALAAVFWLALGAVMGVLFGRAGRSGGAGEASSPR